MPYTITDDCMACGNCSVVCPVDAIEDGYTYNTSGDIKSTTDVVMDGAIMEKSKSYADTFLINDNCIECGECVDICPTDAIKLLN